MISRRRKPVQRTPMRRVAMPAFAILAAALATMLVTARPDAAAARNHHGPSFEVEQSRHTGTPLMAIVALGAQHITIYDSEGWILRAPVSSGHNGYETPAGVFSVLQKEVEHYSNLYDDASMPHMQRLTWSGIALHGGPLPGYPASHGCIRMPYDFAEHLFDLTKVGMRVIVAPRDVAPALIVDALLFKPRPARGDADAPQLLARPPEPGGEALTAAKSQSSSAQSHKFATLQSIAAAKAAEAAAAAREAQTARSIANKMTWEIARAQSALRLAEFALSRADALLGAAENALATARSPQASAAAQEAYTLAFARVLDAQLRVDAATAQVENEPDPASARAEAEAAGARSDAAAEAAKQAAHNALPISVFISRKTQRLYVRQASEPLFDSAVTIRNPEQHIGTHIFTALAYTDGNTDLRWNVVSMPESSRDAEAGSSGRHHHAEQHSERPPPQSTQAASQALRRIEIPQEALDRISQLVSPGSSLIISDEGMSSETGHGTDFVVVMSDEPQGGLKIRHRSPEVASRSRVTRYADRYGRPASRPYYGGNSWGGNSWGGNSWGGSYWGGNSYGGYRGGNFFGFNHF